MILGISEIEFPFDESGESGLTSTMMRHGYVAAAPLHPSLGVSIKLLDLFRAMNSCSGNVGITPFVRAMCEFQMV